MAYYIDINGRTVVLIDFYAVSRGLPEGTYNDFKKSGRPIVSCHAGRIFAVHPDDNPRIRKNKEGVYEYRLDAPGEDTEWISMKLDAPGRRSEMKNEKTKWDARLRHAYAAAKVYLRQYSAREEERAQTALQVFIGTLLGSETYQQLLDDQEVEQTILAGVRGRED